MTATVTPAGKTDEKLLRDIDTLQRLGETLAGKRIKAIEARVALGIDERWFNDVEAYEGRDAVTRQYAGLRATVQGYLDSVPGTKRQTRSTLIPNVTRSKVNADSARLQDIALPTDDRNWDLRPSTIPEMVEKMGQKDVGLVKNGQPIMVMDGETQRQATAADYAGMVMEDAKKASKAMRDEIDDQMDMSKGGCGYEGVVRAAMDDHSLLGTGIIKGPSLTSRTKTVWMPISAGGKTVHVLQRISDRKPQSARVNPWDIYPHPECGENPTKFPIWERIPGVTAKDLRDWASIPGYRKEQIRKVLLEGPRKPENPPDKPGAEAVVTEETVFEAWEYHGDLTTDELQAAGCPCSGEDIFTSHSAVCIMVNNTVIKAEIEILDSGDMPYDFFVTNKCSGQWAGYGTAFLARSAQKVITSGWRTMLDNMGWYVGPQIVMNRTKMDPADGNWEMRGMKLWYAKGDVEDVGKCFAVHEISAHQAEYAAIIKMGMDFLDNETALPQLAQGEQGDATDVLGGMNILLNASNTMMRRKLKCFDDQVTIRHIGRYVDWNMQYNPKNEIKGDFEVQARASGALMDMEIQNKAAVNLLNIAKDPEFAHGMKKWDALRRVIRSFRFDPTDFVKSDEDIKKIEDDRAKQPQQIPALMVAELKAKAEADLAAKQQVFDAAQNEADRRNKLVVAAIDERLASTQLTSQERQNLEKIKGTLAKTTLELSVQKQLSAGAMKQADDHEVARHATDIYKHRNPPQVAKPPTEPAGRAPNGKAFQA